LKHKIQKPALGPDWELGFWNGAIIPDTHPWEPVRKDAAGSVNRFRIRECALIPSNPG
jgi:hypothetical protein